MPNINNILSPATVISFGRSGTSLLSSILDHRQDIDFVGETAQLLFSTWRGAETSFGIVRRNIDRGARYELDNNDFCAEAVRSVFLGLFPSSKPYWLQKPIGIPECFWILNKDPTTLGAWYWNVVKKAFPNGKYMTILRNPIDVAVSAHYYWGFKITEIINQLGQMANIIIHKDSMVKYAVNYSELVYSPKDSIVSMCNYLEFEFEPRMLDAMVISHAPQSKIDANGVYVEKPSSIIRKILDDPEYIIMQTAVKRLWSKFGVDVEDFSLSSTYIKSAKIEDL